MVTSNISFLKEKEKGLMAALASLKPEASGEDIMTELHDVTSKRVAAESKVRKLLDKAYAFQSTGYSVARLDTALCQKIASMIENTAKAFQGIAAMAICFEEEGKPAVHALYLCYQPDNAIFTIIDSNIGLCQLESSEQFIDCLTQLVEMLYPSWNELSTYWVSGYC